MSHRGRSLSGRQPQRRGRRNGSLTLPFRMKPGRTPMTGPRRRPRSRRVRQLSFVGRLPFRARERVKRAPRFQRIRYALPAGPVRRPAGSPPHFSRGLLRIGPVGKIRELCGGLEERGIDGTRRRSELTSTGIVWMPARLPPGSIPALLGGMSPSPALLSCARRSDRPAIQDRSSGRSNPSANRNRQAGRNRRSGRRIAWALLVCARLFRRAGALIRKYQNPWGQRRGAHLMLQTRMRVLDGTLRAKFQSWYPGLFDVQNPDRTEHALAA